MTHKEKAEAFLKISSQFRLDVLDTEKSHPKSRGLSDLVINDLPGAIGVLKEIDIEALQVVNKQVDGIKRMKADIENTLSNDHRVFLAGCGSTGRLSLVLEVLWRKERTGTRHEDSVVSFMAGGDTALIKSIENFEDYPDFGARQLEELGFSNGDLLIACTEGGETPFVIGATERAAGISSVSPWFLYCNPDEILMGLTERTTNILNNPSVNRINLSAGPMGISGSTRMQASTILMYAVGLALLNSFSDPDITPDINEFVKRVKKTDYGFLAKLIKEESRLYKTGSYIVYSTHDDLGISVLTDTTERSPTFTLDPFENYLNRESKPSLCYLCLPETPDPVSAWRSLLRREPRPLDWEGYAITAGEYLYGFDFSRQGLTKRKEKIGHSALETFDISRQNGKLQFRLKQVTGFADIEGLTLLQQHLLMKMMLNIHSTLVMGKLGRYESNMMTYVTLSNNKLINRAAVYVLNLLERKGVRASYEEVIRALFAEMDKGTGTRSLVLDTVERIRKDEG